MRRSQATQRRVALLLLSSPQRKVTMQEMIRMGTDMENNDD
jgi:hypothetical protein